MERSLTVRCALFATEEGHANNLPANKKGKPFGFTIGDGSVIKGWDLGVAGMQAGGERRIVIPADLAYGKKGTAGIPGNAELTFDLKLMEVN